MTATDVEGAIVGDIIKKGVQEGDQDHAQAPAVMSVEAKIENSRMDIVTINTNEPKYLKIKLIKVIRPR